MFQNISIVIVNSSHEAMGNLASVLESRILSRQRPHIVCLSHHELRLERSFFEDFINEKLTECRRDLERAKQMSEFNQLEAWRAEREPTKGASKRRSTSSRISKESRKIQFSFSNRERDRLQGIIIDFPIEHGIELYLILFDISDCDTIKSIASFELVPLLGIVTFYPREQSCERFWKQFDSSDLDDVAFIDIDAPVESNYILGIRSQLIYDQFCHLLYDFEELKRSYREFRQRLVIHDVSIDVTANENDLRQLRERLDQIPHCMMSIERIYDAILEQIEHDASKTMADDGELSKFMDFEAFGKRFYDMSDEWGRGFSENPSLYARELHKLERYFGDIWREECVESITLERRQILNYFMNKIAGCVENYSKGTSNHLEFNFYILKFLNWTSEAEASNDREFIADRSIGHRKLTNGIERQRQQRLRGVTSDIRIDYRNLSKIPDEIERLVSDTVNFREENGKNFYARLLTPAGMLQNLHQLTKVYGEHFYRQYFQLFDVLLLKFPPRTVPPRFSSIEHKKALPTPLCFRDFVHYAMPLDSLRETKATTATERDCKTFHGSGDERNKAMRSDYKPENFILAASIKSQRTSDFHNDDDDYDGDASEQCEEAKKSDASTADEVHVYNACSRRLEYCVSESAFNSYRLSTSASVFASSHESPRRLTFSSTLHDTKHLSCSFDLHESGCHCTGITLVDDNVGMICGIDRDNVKLSYPHGMLIEINDVSAIEVNWIELNERISGAADAETKRTYFSDGFVMMHTQNGAIKILSSNGTIYEITPEQRQVTEQRECNRELTERHRFAVAAAGALKKFVSFSSVVMTLACGHRFVVEGESIVAELEPLHVHEWCDRGGSYTLRDDGLRLLRTDGHTKCQYADGTIITSVHSGMDMLVAESDYGAARQPLPLLDALWRSEAENESKFVIDDVLHCVASDYFLNINQTCQFEHAKCGRFRFDANEVEVELPNGATVRKRRHGECRFAFHNGVSVRLTESRLRFFDEKCDECFGNNEILVNLAADGADDILVTAIDIERNIFEIKASGQQRFYENDTCQRASGRECKRCKGIQREFLTEHYGERWFVLNRDMSGYEITPQRPKCGDVNVTVMETKDTLMLCDDATYETMPIDDRDDFNIDFPLTNNGEEEKNDMNEMLQKSTNGIMSSSERRRSSASSRRSAGGESSQLNVSGETRRQITGKRRPEELNSLEMERAAIEKKPQQITSPWVTADDSSITADISGRRRDMIRFYVNPLDALPASISVNAILKLRSSSLRSLAAAVRRVGAHAIEKSVINVGTMTLQQPAVKRTFEEHFECTVRRSTEQYVEEKLEHFRAGTARAIVEDLLRNAFASLVGRSSSSEIDKCHLDKASDAIHDEFSNNRETCAAVGAHPIAIKSFSFV